MKKDSAFAFIAGIIITLAVSFLIFYIAFRSIDLDTWVGVAVGEILLWLSAWRIFRHKRKWSISTSAL